jgi:competence protein ComEC
MDLAPSEYIGVARCANGDVAICFDSGGRTSGGVDGICAACISGVGDKIMGIKHFHYLLGLILGLAILVVSQLPGEKARMVVCDVGQGDAILIIKGRNQALIDGGPSSEKILSCLEKYVPFYDRQIELIVLTNTDFDHMNGLSAVVERYQVMQFVTSDGVHESTALDKFIDKLAENNIAVSSVEGGDKINVGGQQTQTRLVFDVLWPADTIEENVAIFSDQMDKSKREQILGASAKRGNLNERSVVLLLLEDNKKILLTGDSGDQAEKWLVAHGSLPMVDILKVGHHGSKYASGLEYLQQLRPELAIISVGAKNRYGHPTSEAMERLEKVGAKIRRTDKEGTIVIDL